MRQMIPATLLHAVCRLPWASILIVAFICTGLPGCHDDATGVQRPKRSTPTATPTFAPSPAPTSIPPGGPNRPPSTPTPTPENRGSLTDSGVGAAIENRVTQHYEINVSLGATFPAAELYSERATYRIQEGSFVRLDEGSQ